MNLTKDNLQLYRKRIIPEECFLLKDDIIEYVDEEVVITTWHTIRTKSGFDHGASCYFLKEGIKVSKFYRPDNSLLCWYCDIIHYDVDEALNALTATDLLADVIIYPDGTHQVADLDELSEALEKNLISKELVTSCLMSLHNLLITIYRDKFDRLSDYLDRRGL